MEIYPVNACRSQGKEIYKNMRVIWKYERFDLPSKNTDSGDIYNILVCVSKNLIVIVADLNHEPNALNFVCRKFIPIN